jgi:hypothetical protein
MKALPTIEDQVMNFYADLFEAIFSRVFGPEITQRQKRTQVINQVEESADAAAQSLIRLFLNERLSEEQVAEIMMCFAPLPDTLTLDRITVPNQTPDSIVAQLSAALQCPPGILQAGRDAIYSLALYSVVQILTLVGPVMAEWQKLGFSSTFELPRRVINRLNQISDQLGALGQAGQAAADARYELLYRDHLLQRFHRVEVGTVRMTTNLLMDLRELFVMPRVRAQTQPKKRSAARSRRIELWNLAKAREVFASRTADSTRKKGTQEVTALQQVKNCGRNVIIAAPGVGKSTFLEWLQMQVASAAPDAELVLGGQQAIPILLRVRQLDLQNLPQGAALIERATGSQQLAALMPRGWAERQMKAGRVLFILDGLDEAEPVARDQLLIPWLLSLCQTYKDCYFVISSRPVGYPPGTLGKAGFIECELLDFDSTQIEQYTIHWCTAVLLAQNELEAEARAQGERDGKEIVAGFKDNPYILNLARNPLMLSAICLVNYFEHGRLPEERALLYQMCVEGLLHHWDQRRGIRSDFALEEKLQVCREVAIAMQANDRAECDVEDVRKSFIRTLGDAERGSQLLEHIRYRSGLLVERRPEVFAFAHLTFQEYLAARAVQEGNGSGVDVERLAAEHADGRWTEVIPLYCGLASAAAARRMIDLLIAQDESTPGDALPVVLAEAYASAKPRVGRDEPLRDHVIERIARAPLVWEKPPLERFPPEAVAPIANAVIGMGDARSASAAYGWLVQRPEQVLWDRLVDRLRGWHGLNPFGVSDLVYLLHYQGPDALLGSIASDGALYRSPVSSMREHQFMEYGSQAELAWVALLNRSWKRGSNASGAAAALLAALQALADISVPLGNSPELQWSIIQLSQQSAIAEWTVIQEKSWLAEFMSTARRLAARMEQPAYVEYVKQSPVRLGPDYARLGATFHSWIDALERRITTPEHEVTLPLAGDESPVARVGRRRANHRGTTPLPTTQGGTTQ